MGKVLKVRSLEIGSGLPKIIAPIVGASHEEILNKTKELSDMKIDMVEWRADFFDNIFDTGQVLSLLLEMRKALKEMPLLFTFRTKNEGGQKEISIEGYKELNVAVAKSGEADFVDVEVFLDDGAAVQIIDAVHATERFVVGSNHDFNSTPPKDELVRRLRRMQDVGADIAKIAVMPTSMADVLELLSATNEMHEHYAKIPLITMSMSSKGVVSRIAGGVFGSSMTFGAVGQVSAPGQIAVDELARALDILHGHSDSK